MHDVPSLMKMPLPSAVQPSTTPVAPLIDNPGRSLVTARDIRDIGTLNGTKYIQSNLWNAYQDCYYRFTLGTRSTFTSTGRWLGGQFFDANGNFDWPLARPMGLELLDSKGNMISTKPIGCKLDAGTYYVHVGHRSNPPPFVYSTTACDAVPFDLNLITTLVQNGFSSARDNGMDDFATSTSSPLSLAVRQAKTKATLTASTTSAVAGQRIVFTATISVVSPGVGMPIGTVTFWDGMTKLGTVTLNSGGRAQWSTSNLGVGTHPITVSYGGDVNFKTSVSSKLSVKVKAATASSTIQRASARLPASDINDAAITSLLAEWDAQDSLDSVLSA